LKNKRKKRFFKSARHVFQAEHFSKMFVVLDTSMKAKNIAVIGSGITGLSAAFYLKRNGHSVKVFDKNSRTGGVIQSIQKNGFTYETGPSTGVISKPEVTELFEDLGKQDLLETAPSLAGNRYIWKNGKLHVIPSGPIGGLKTPLFSWKDKFGILLEPFRPKGTDPEENLSSFVRRRLGNSILDYTVDPFISGVYAGSPDVTIPKYALPKLYNLEQNYGSLIRGSIHKMKEPKSERDKKATKKTFSAKGGLSTLVEALAKAIGAENFVLNANLYVKPENGSYKVVDNGNEYGPFDSVVLTSGASHVFDILPFAKGKGFDSASEVLYAKVAEVAVGFNKWEGFPLDGFGALIPSKEHKKILGVLFMSSLFQGRAPEGGAMLATFLGGLRHPEYVDLPDEAIKEMVSKEVKEVLSIPHFTPDLFEISRHEEAIPQYDLSTPKRISAYAGIEKAFPGILMGGNGIGGIGMADRIKQGRDLAERLA